MKYVDAADVKEKIIEIVTKLDLRHIDINRIACIKSKGSKARGIIARCHALPKALQHGMQCQPFYCIELISKRFDKLNEKEKTKTLIHELLHIPRSFGGGFRHHSFVKNSRVNQLYSKLKKNED